MTPEALSTAAVFVAAASSIAIIAWWFAARPSVLARSTVLALLLGIGVLPIFVAGVGNVKGFEASKTVEFCSGCHVMQGHVADVLDDESTSLASLHARNELLGDEACYECHADYSMYGTVLTKVQGTRHLWAYYTGGYRGLSLEDALKKIEIYEPYPNSNCMHCHSTMLPGWNDEPEHGAVVEDVRSGATSCISSGCHEPAHAPKLGSAVPVAKEGG